MKRILTTVLMLGALGLAACANKEDGATPVTRNQAAMAPAQQVAASNGISLNGKVVTDSRYQTEFQEVVGGYISALWSPTALGYVSATATGSTGFFLGGRVDLNSGVLNVANPGTQQIRSNSILYIEVRDEFWNRPDGTGATVPAFSRAFQSASGSVQGNRVVLTFSDAAGSVTLNGTISGQVFYGDFAFDNRANVAGGGTKAGTVGGFVLPTCQFFRCQ